MRERDVEGRLTSVPAVPKPVVRFLQGFWDYRGRKVFSKIQQYRGKRIQKER